jgi:PleD family two-component response regulator
MKTRETAQSSHDHPEGTAMTNSILIVNGSHDRRHCSREVLERSGYHVREIIAMDRALEDARRDPPLAIVVEAPENPEQPVRFTELLHRHPTTRHVPVLVLCPDADVARAHAERSGVSWLAEPCPSQALLEEIAYLTRPVRAPGPSFGTSERSSV